MTHADPDNQPPDGFGGKVTLHVAGGHEPYLLLPIIRARRLVDDITRAITKGGV